MADSTTKTVGVDLAKQVFVIRETNRIKHITRFDPVKRPPQHSRATHMLAGNPALRAPSYKHHHHLGTHPS